MSERAYTQEQLVRRLQVRQDTLVRQLRAQVAAGGPLFDLRGVGELQPDGSLLIRDPAALEAALKRDLQAMLAALAQTMLATAFAERP